MRFSRVAIGVVLVALAGALLDRLVRQPGQCAEGKATRISGTIREINHFKVGDHGYWIIHLKKGAGAECAIEKVSPDKEPPPACKAGSAIEASGRIYREGWLQVGDLQCGAAAG